MHFCIALVILKTLTFLTSLVLLETSFAFSCFVSSVLCKSWGQIKQCLNSKENLCIVNTSDKDVMSSHLLLTTLPASAGIISLKLDMYLAVSRPHLPVEIAGGCYLSGTGQEQECCEAVLRSSRAKLHSERAVLTVNEGGQVPVVSSLARLCPAASFVKSGRQEMSTVNFLLCPAGPG